MFYSLLPCRIVAAWFDSFIFAWVKGDWELRTDKSPVPVKLTVKQFIGADWMIACMVPKGNMMHCMLREVDGAIKQLKYSITGKEIPVEIMEIETIMSQFFEGEINDIRREGQLGKAQKKKRKTNDGISIIEVLTPPPRQ